MRDVGGASTSIVGPFLGESAVVTVTLGRVRKGKEEDEEEEALGVADSEEEKVATVATEGEGGLL